MDKAMNDLTTSELAMALAQRCNCVAYANDPESKQISEIAGKLNLSTDDGASILIGIAYRLGWRFEPDCVMFDNPELYSLVRGWEYEAERAF